MADTWVQRGADDFAQVIENELPTGQAWSRDPANPLMDWVNGCAQIWGDVSAAAAQLLLVESDPRYTRDLLTDWETTLGLPDPCLTITPTLPERHTALVQKLSTQGGQSRAYFIGVAASLGYEIDIREFVPFAFGRSSFGGSRGQIQGPGVRFYWTVRIKQPRATRFCFGTSSFGRDSFLEIIRATDLECIFKRWKPAHTVVQFFYETSNEVMNFFFPY